MTLACVQGVSLKKSRMQASPHPPGKILKLHPVHHETSLGSGLCRTRATTDITHVTGDKGPEGDTTTPNISTCPKGVESILTSKILP